MTGVENQLAEIVSQSGFVGIKSFLGSVFATEVDRNSNGLGELGSKTSGLEFSKSESSAESGSVAVSNGVAVDGGSEFVKGSGSRGGGKGSSVLKSSFLAAGLVEPGADVALPVFPKVDIGDAVVMLNHGR